METLTNSDYIVIYGLLAVGFLVLSFVYAISLILGSLIDSSFAWQLALTIGYFLIAIGFTIKWMKRRGNIAAAS